jgi:two-component system response regulator NreC
MDAAPVFLLVEPSPILRSRLQEWLESVLTDPRIFLAANGLEALNFAMQEKPSHILIEMDLPDTNGAEVVQQMRQRLPTARIIVTGGYDSRLILEILQSAGADGFILKNKLQSDLLPLWKVISE